MISSIEIDVINYVYKEYEINRSKILNDLYKLKSIYENFTSLHRNYKHVVIVGNDIHAKAAKAWLMIPYSWLNMYSQHMQVTYLDNFSPDSLWEIIANCDLQNTYVIFISYESFDTAAILTFMRFIESISRFVDHNINEHIIIATNIENSDRQLLELAELFSIDILPLSLCIFQPIYPGVLFPALMWGINSKRIIYSTIQHIEKLISHNENIIQYIYQVISFFYLKSEYMKIIVPSSDKLRPFADWWKELIASKIDMKYIYPIDTIKPIYYLKHCVRKSYTSILFDDSLTRDSLNFNIWKWKLEDQNNKYASTTLRKWTEENNHTILKWIRDNKGFGRIINVRSLTQEDDICALMLFIALEVDILSIYINKIKLKYELNQITLARI